MANTNLLTYGAKISSVEQLYYSPVAVLPSLATVPIGTIYCFLSSVTPWPNNTPPVPTQDQKTLKSIFKNMFAAKLVSSADISPVIQRINWTSGNTYQYYRDDIDMFALHSDGTLVNQFYVKNRYDQVFKCLWNNNTSSTDEPVFQPGQYGTNNIYTGTDGYKWKYIYSIDAGLKIKFMDATWMPVPVGQNTPNTETTAGMGSIDVINVSNGGTGYDPANSAVTITVTGDGTGAAAQVGTVTGGVIQNIVVNNTGTNYTYANVSITSANTQVGSGATAFAPSSPIGGHGFDPASELGCYNAMVTCEFDMNEMTNGISMVPTNDANGNPIEYYQMGLIINPTTQSNYPYPATGSIYKLSTDFVVAAAPDTGYVSGETIYQGTSSAPTFTATVLSFDLASNVLRLINTYGTPTTNKPVFGSKAARTLLSVSTPDFVIGSGYLSYIQNLTGIQRSADGIEQFKMVLSY